MVGRLAAGAALTLDQIETEMMGLFILEDEDIKVNTKQESDVALFGDGDDAKGKKRWKKDDKKPFKKFTGKCNHCGKVGHKEANCWDDPKNGDRRPKTWKTRDNASNDIAEIALVTFEAYTSLTYKVDRETYFNKELGYCEYADTRPAYRENIPSEDAVQVDRIKWHNGVPCGVSRLPCGTECYAYHGSVYFLDKNAEDEILAAMEEDEEEEMSYLFCDDRVLSFDSLESEELEYVSYCMDPQPKSCVALDLPGRRIFYEEDGSFALAATGEAGTRGILSRKNIMVADTGASCHIFTSMDWMTNVKTSKESRGIRVGGQRVIGQQGIGDLPVTFKDKNGLAGPSVTLKNVKILENFGFNLFSLTRAMLLGWSMPSEHPSNHCNKR
jgi:hypothetical protein